MNENIAGYIWMHYSMENMVITPFKPVTTSQFSAPAEKFHCKD